MFPKPITSLAVQSIVVASCLTKCAASSYSNQNINPKEQWVPPPPLANPPYQFESEDMRRPPPPLPTDPGLSRSDRSNNIQSIDPARTTYTPIDYKFRSKRPETPQRFGPWRRNKNVSTDEIPITTSNIHADSVGDDDVPEFVTPRRDAVGRQMSTFKGRLSLRAGSMLVGFALGAFTGKSLFNAPSFGIGTAILFFILSFFRNAYGELARALGLTLILVWQRTFAIRSRYVTWPHIKASLGMSPRRPFPREDDFQSREISFLYTLVAMGFVGSACGGNMPLLPTWMGALGGASLFVFMSTLRNARGDLCRSMGMRLVAVVEELFDINSELRVLQKSGDVAGRILDKILILDRKHSIKDRIASALTFLFDQIANAAGRIDRGRRDDSNTDEGRRRSDRGDDSRRDTTDRRQPYDKEYYQREGNARRDYTKPNDRRDFRPTADAPY